jgi:putative peptide zinc metalloprotease protein
MVTLHDSLVSSSARNLAIRKRPDLVARRQHYLGRSYWVVKDPVGLQYFRFQDEEFAILQMLDGETSLDEIKDRFEEEFPPQKITLEELQQFLGMLHRSGLVIADVAGQGEQLRKRRWEKKRREWMNAISNILCIRFKGFDPERFLNWLYPWVAWFFSPIAAVICILFGLSALGLVCVQFHVFQSRLPEFHQFFNAHNGVWLAIVLCVTKVMHEFGHGLSCKHFGGECHEMGVMILVLTPCLYCNVSDSWMLPNKWHRAFIGMAGMYVELVLASICTYCWWFSQPDTLFNRLCLDVIFVSSVSTVVFNANPLLRYDGYYILADLVEIPNLRQKATTILSRKLAEWCLGMEPPEDPFLPQRNQIFFALYSVAAAVYRWVVALSICYFLYKLFRSYDLQVIGEIVVLMSLWGLLVMPLYRVGKFFYVPGRLDQVKKPRFYASLSVVTVLLLLVVFLPLPQSVICPVELQARDARPVSVRVAGNLASVEVKQGERVVQGQLLAVLRNPDTELAIAKNQAAIKECQVKLIALRQRGVSDKHVFGQIAVLNDSLKTYQEQLVEKILDHTRLRLVAPVDGIVLPPSITERRGDPEERLPQWAGSPLDPENLGAYLEVSTLFCQIGDPHRLEAVLVIDQADRNLVQEGQHVDIILESHPYEIIHSDVTEIAGKEMRAVSKRLSKKSGGDLDTKADEKDGTERPMSPSYEAKAPIDDPNGQYRLGVRGQARIYTDWVPLGTRLWRFVHHTFNFKI